MGKESNAEDFESNLEEKAVEGTAEHARTHKVGTFTSGFCMVGFGVMLLLHNLLDVLDYEMILGLWPLILIGMGIELLLSTAFNKKIIYDKAAVVLLFVMTLLALFLAGADVCFELFRAYWY